MENIDGEPLKDLGFSITKNNNWIRKADKGMEILVPQENGTYIPYIRPRGFTHETADDFHYPAIGIPGIIIMQENDVNSVFCKIWEQFDLTRIVNN